MWTRLLRPARDEDGVPDSVLTLTAIILLLRPLDVWWVAPFVLAAACLSLVLRPVRRAPLTWMLVAALVAAGSSFVWPLSDNHIYLLAYWCLAIGLALSSPTPAATLSTQQPMAAGAAFAMAVLWKAVLSPDYVDGRFFRVTLLTDERFADASLVFGGLSRDQMAENRTFLEPLPEGAELLEPPAFVEPPRLRVFAAGATWGGLALEALIALLCLIPAGRRRPGRATCRAARVLRHHLRAGAGGRLRVADRDDGPRAVPSRSARVARRLHRRVRPDPAVLRDSLDRRAGGLDGPLRRASCGEAIPMSPAAGRGSLSHCNDWPVPMARPVLQ